MLMIVALSYYYYTSAQFLSETKTSGDVRLAIPENWVQYAPQYVNQDDDSYAYTKPLWTFGQTGFISFLDFGFNIPIGATIENIIIKVKRFKMGKLGVRDISAWTVSRCVEDYCSYGMQLSNQELWPSEETEITYSEPGSGIDFFGSPFQWTPAMVNDSFFGFSLSAEQIRIQGKTESAIHGRPGAIAYIDLLTITVEYSVPSSLSASSLQLKEAFATNEIYKAVAYPNPFSTQTTIRFTAKKDARTLVELYNIKGEKIETLFSSDVHAGQDYNITVQEAVLPKGIYIYTISNGKQKQTGRIIKIE